MDSLSPKFYGLSVIPIDNRKEYGYALLAIAGSDGEVSDPELEWLTVEVSEACNIDKDMIQAWEDFDYIDADLDEIFGSFNSNAFVSYKKLLIYDAIRMCYADDDYADDERELVAEAASILKVSDETVIAIESLVEMERAVDKLRYLVL